jgi:PKD repeat protein
VTVTSSCDAAAWHWDFGDGTSADGQTASHTFAGGTFTIALTRTQADGSSATDTAQVTAYGIAVRPPKRTAYGTRATFRGKVVSGEASAVTLTLAGHAVAHAAVGADGWFTLRPVVQAPGPYRVTSGDLVSNTVSLVVRPRVSVRLVGGAALGGHATAVAQLVPAGAGTLDLTVRSAGRTVAHTQGHRVVRLPLDPRAPGSYRIVARVSPVHGFAPAQAALSVPVTVPELERGSTGPAVHALEERLLALHYALERVDSTFGDDTYDAVVAFQKVHGLDRTGVMTATDWAVLLRAGIPAAQVTGDAIEVDKTKQVLFVVRHGETQLVIPVSTGATGNTPIGTFHVYRKVPGFDWVLYYPSYFLRGFAVHGYPDVPTYPASHGCVRIPMWVSQRIYDLIPFGSRIVIHY